MVFVPVFGGCDSAGAGVGADQYDAACDEVAVFDAAVFFLFFFVAQAPCVVGVELVDGTSGAF